MFLVKLWTDYVSKTMPVLTAGGLPLVCLQMFGGLPPLLSLYASVRRDSAAERVVLCMVPGIFVVTAAIVEPLLFGAFLGEGFPWVDALRAFISQHAFFSETALLAAFCLLLVFVGLLLSWRESSVRAPRFLLDNGVALVVSFLFLFLGADHFLLGGRMFSRFGGAAVKWTVYGVYLLLYQSCVLGVCLVWRLLFSESRLRDGAPGRVRWLRRYLRRSYRAYGWGLLMFSALFAVAVVGGLYREGSPYGPFLAVNVGMFFLAAVFFVKALFLPDVRRILSWGDEAETLCQLHRELLELPPLAKTDIGFLTEHYLVLERPKRIYCRELLESVSARGSLGALVLTFSDGGRCRINSIYRQLLDPLTAKPRSINAYLE